MMSYMSVRCLKGRLLFVSDNYVLCLVIVDIFLEFVASTMVFQVTGHLENVHFLKWYLWVGVSGLRVRVLWFCGLGPSIFGMIYFRNVTDNSLIKIMPITDLYQIESI